MRWTDELKPCPFCGNRELTIELYDDGRICAKYAGYGSIYCQGCGAGFRNVLSEPEHYERVEGDLYCRIPKKYAEDVILDKWNRRAKDDNRGND